MMQDNSKYDLIGDYPYGNVDEKFARKFLKEMTEPKDLEAAGLQLERRICPYGPGIKANQVDVALAVREVLKFPFYSENPELREKSRAVLANLVKKSADDNGGTVDGSKVVRLFMQYKNSGG